MLSTYDYLGICFLPPNTTAIVQPLDTDIIAKVKSISRRRLFLCVPENIEAEKKSVYNVDFLTAMRWASIDWNNVSSDRISNWFRHSLEREISTLKN